MSSFGKKALFGERVKVIVDGRECQAGMVELVWGWKRGLLAGHLGFGTFGI